MRRSPVIASLIALGLVAAACGGSAPVQPKITITQGGGGSVTSAGTVGGDPVISLVERVRPSVVNVSTDALQNNGFGLEPGGGTGTGFIIRSDGVVVTNYHVVEGAQRITVVTPDPGSERYDARVIGGDPAADIAVLKVDAKGLPTVDLGSSDRLKLGQPVVAIGYALALDGGPSVTTGIVSALDRVVGGVQDPNCEDCPLDESGVPTRTYRSVIQTDAAINPGNSGGPLLNLDGEVVGINSAGVGAAQADNIGFSIALDSARSTIQHAIDNPSEPQAYLGVLTQTVSPSLANQFSLPVTEGAYIIETAQGGPADKAGVEAGDVMVEFDGSGVTNNDDFAAAIDKTEPGDRVEIGLVRGDGEDVRVEVTLGTKPLP